jgi:hypothetical protein
MCDLRLLLRDRALDRVLGHVDFAPGLNLPPWQEAVFLQADQERLCVSFKIVQGVSARAAQLSMQRNVIFFFAASAAASNSFASSRG